MTYYSGERLEALGEDEPNLGHLRLVLLFVLDLFPDRSRSVSCVRVLFLEGEFEGIAKRETAPLAKLGAGQVGLLASSPVPAPF